MNMSSKSRHGKPACKRDFFKKPVDKSSVSVIQYFKHKNLDKLSDSFIDVFWLVFSFDDETMVLKMFIHTPRCTQ